MCGLIQRESGRIIGNISLVGLIGVVIGGILVEKGFRCGIYVGLVEDRQREILIDQESGSDTFPSADGNDYGTASGCLNASFGAF